MFSLKTMSQGFLKIAQFCRVYFYFFTWTVLIILLLFIITLK